MFLVPLVKKEIGVESFIGGSKVDATVDATWADGMLGCVPVFEDRESAEVYADGKCEIVEIQEVK